MMRAAFAVPWAWLLLVAACGPTLPPRYVHERDLGAFAYRRYQKSLDIEVPIRGNPATGHTASYLRRGAQDGVAVVTAFVTAYARAHALAAEARDALENLGGYSLTTAELEGEYVWVLDAPGRERWCVWVSEERLIKIGVQPGQEFPEPVVEAYLETYPSDLDGHGRARPDAPSAGKPKARTLDEDDALAVPRDLRENAPR